MLGTGTIFTSKVFCFLQNVESVTGFLLGYFCHYCGSKERLKIGLDKSSRLTGTWVFLLNRNHSLRFCTTRAYCAYSRASPRQRAEALPAGLLLLPSPLQRQEPRALPPRARLCQHTSSGQGVGGKGSSVPRRRYDTVGVTAVRWENSGWLWTPSEIWEGKKRSWSRTSCTSEVWACEGERWRPQVPLNG